MDAYEQALQRANARPELPPIVSLPPVIDGKTYFNKASARRFAMTMGHATEPGFVEPVRMFRKPQMRRERPKVKCIHHWSGSRCSRLGSTWWSEATRARIVDGDRFIALAHQDQCQGCRREFENA